MYNMPTCLADVASLTAPNDLCVPDGPLPEVGAVDCAQSRKLCKKLKVGEVPEVRRFRAGTSATYTGDLRSLEDLATWSEAQRDEL